MTMNYNESKAVEKIRAQYTAREVTPLDELKALDRRVKKPAEVFSYVFGILGTLVLGVGMCLAMKVIGDMVLPGIVIGSVGIAMVCVNHLFYRAILSARKKKYAAEICERSDALLNQ